jgi:serine/threonine protein kinase
VSGLSPERWQEISPYLDHALSLSEDQRAEWLRTLRAQRSDLADVLEELLEEHHALAQDHFLEHQFPPPINDLATGATLGPYKLISPIGEGGMGQVWLAERADGRFERQVAVKFLRLALGSRGAAERFEREGRIVGQLTHPHIAELVDAGVTPNGGPYLILEYVKGQPIDAYCDERKLGVDARIELFLDVLGAIAHAHASLVVHRDIKPSNVFVNETNEVKLLDFGIAKLLRDDTDPAAATLLTVESGGAMTPLFAAPEQITGGAITTATDVYALGILLFLLLTGQHPAGPGPHSTADLVRVITEAEPPRPSEVVAQDQAKSAAEKRSSTPDKLRRELRGDLDTIVAKALKKDSAERYSSVTALAHDLQRYLKHEPISARPDTIIYRATKFARRNRLGVALTAMALAATVAGLTGTLIQARNARRQRDFALRQLNRAEAINEFNQFILSDASPSGKPFTTKELLDHATHILEKQRGASGDRVELMATVGLQFSFLGEQKEAIHVLQEAYDLSRQVPEMEVRATAACQFASALVLSGDLNRAESLFQEGIRDLPNEPQLAFHRVECLRRGSEVAQERGDAQTGVARMEAAQRVLQDSTSNSAWGRVDVLVDLGEAYRMAGQNYKASSVFEQANNLLSSLGRDDTRTTGVLYNDWALALERLGRPLEAERLFRRSIEIQGAGAEPILLNNYAITLRSLARLQDALNYSETSYRQAQQAADNFAIYRSLYLRALIYLDQDHFERAAEMSQQLVPILKRQLPPDSLWFGLSASVEALLESGNGNSQQALLLADRAVAILERSIKSRGQGADILPLVLLRRASIELAASRPAQAEADAARALEQLKAAIQPGAYSSYVGTAYLELGHTLQAEGKPHEAHAAFRSAAEHLQATLPADHPDVRTAVQLAAPNPQ